MITHVQCDPHSPGCQQTGPLRWVCSDHTVWGGETLHLACYSDGRVLAVWLDDNRSLTFTEDSATPDGVDWSTAQQKFEKLYPNVLVTDDDMQEAGARLKGLLSDLESNGTQ